VLGNQSGAANTDLEIVARFEFVPVAAGVVCSAMARLRIWDPWGWRNRVWQIRSGLFERRDPRRRASWDIAAEGCFWRTRKCMR
jgi:hypothetical protein